MKIDTTWLIFAVVAVSMMSFLFSTALDALLDDAGFGALGNALIVTTTFFGTIQLTNSFGTRFDGILDATLAGLAGAFAALLLLVMLKLLLNRIF